LGIYNWKNLHLIQDNVQYTIQNKGLIMYRIQLDQDIKSVSEFRAHTTSYINQVKETKRPLVLTQHGKSSAVLLDVAEYEKLIDKLEVIQEVRSAQREISKGKGIEHGEALDMLLGRLDV
jgi:antitoxin YefM